MSSPLAEGLAPLKLAPSAFDIIESLERKHGFPERVRFLVFSRVYRFLRRHHRFGRRVLSPLETEDLVFRFLGKVIRDLLRFVTNIGIGIDEAEGAQILGLPLKAAFAAKLLSRRAA